MRAPIAAFLLALPLGSTFAEGAGAAKLYVERNGQDTATCGGKKTPCQTITAALDHAQDGDDIVVGPGTYGDVGLDGLLGQLGDETPPPGCGCVLAVNKGVRLTSSRGAAVTVIEGRTVHGLNATVALFMNGGEFGRPGKGFTVTNTYEPGSAGIVIDSGNIAVRGNQIVNVGNNPAERDIDRRGITTVDFPQTVLIEANQVIGFGYGIFPRNTGKTVRRNVVSGAQVGIQSETGGLLTGNIVTGSSVAVAVGRATSVIGNAVVGNGVGIYVFGAFPFLGSIERNNLIGNTYGLSNLGIVGLVAENNFWGASTGPGAPPANGVFNDTSLEPLTSTSTSSFARKPFNVKAPIKP